MNTVHRSVCLKIGPSGQPPKLTDATGDTKAGTLIATDRYGNKYYENFEEELPRK